MTGTELVQAPPTSRIELEIGGMTCAACATRIEKKLNKLDGATAIVNYATERAVVTGLPADRAPDVVKSVQQAGYTADVIPTDAAEADRFESNRPDRVGMLRRRLAVAAILTLPLGNLTIALALVPGLRFPYWEWLCVLIAIPVVFWCAWPFHRATLRNLRHRSFSMDTLVSLGVLSAFGWSVVSLLTGSPDDRGYWLGYGITPAGADSIYLEVAAAVDHVPAHRALLRGPGPAVGLRRARRAQPAGRQPASGWSATVRSGWSTVGRAPDRRQLRGPARRDHRGRRHGDRRQFLDRGVDDDRRAGAGRGRAREPGCSAARST